MTMTTKLDPRVADAIRQLINERDCQQILWSRALDEAPGLTDLDCARQYRKAEDHQFAIARCEVALSDLFGINLPTIDVSRSLIAISKPSVEQICVTLLIEKARRAAQVAA